MIESRERRLIEAPSVPGVKEKLRIEVPTPGLITDGTEMRRADDGQEKEECKDNGTMAVSIRTQDREEESVVDVMAPQKDTRAAGVDGWEFKARNSLMFPPDADVTPYQSSGSAAANNARGDPKAIKYGNTRLPEQRESTDSQSISEPPSPTRSRIDAAIAGTPCKSLISIVLT
jgi:protein DGCR14